MNNLEFLLNSNSNAAIEFAHIFVYLLVENWAKCTFNTYFLSPRFVICKRTKGSIHFYDVKISDKTISFI
jgi:hypothetical protein